MASKQLDVKIAEKRHEALVALGIPRVDVAVCGLYPKQLLTTEIRWFKDNYPSQIKETPAHAAIKLGQRGILWEAGIRSEGVLQIFSKEELEYYLRNKRVIEETAAKLGPGRRLRLKDEPLARRAKDIFGSSGNVPVHYLLARRAITDESEAALRTRGLECLADVIAALNCLPFIQNDDAKGLFDNGCRAGIHEILQELALAK